MLLKITRIFALLLTLLFPVFAASAENGSQKEAPVYTNEDIEKYKMPSDNKAPDIIINKASEKTERSKKANEEREQEYWCKKALQYKNKRERMQDNISDIEKMLMRENICWKTKKALRKKLEDAQKKMKYADKDLTDLEDEAHRKGIPAGWLRCQFE